MWNSRTSLTSLLTILDHDVVISQFIDEVLSLIPEEVYYSRDLCFARVKTHNYELVLKDSHGR